ncbi:hypothetical protein [Lactiplantibacillus plajomi]|uniref:Uncharacterized protein n=1 Tax=Lactiplantibacillus plajomi TaxID=1457217 RepID=A0ABV6K3W2_9LACO|nr:hypothetical protein [Lactiplantibacillus plajomi]
MTRQSKPILSRQAQRFAQSAYAHVRHNQVAASDLAQSDQKRQVLRQQHTVVLSRRQQHVLRTRRTVVLSRSHNG